MKRALVIAMAACGLGCGAPSTTHAPASIAPTAARSLHFRRVSTGLVRSITTRETWTLDLDERGTILRGVLERGAPSTVATLDDVAWQTVGEVSYASPKRIDAAAAGVASKLEKVGGDEVLELTCAATKVRVRVAEAKLVHGDACNGDAPRPHWEPTTSSTITVLHCEPPPPTTGEADDADGAHRAFEFAQGPGVEWVYENSDCSAQEGALRAMK
jgi:hypothetical protein